MAKMNMLELRTESILKRVLGQVEIDAQAVDIFGRPDFFVPALNLVIFCDGRFWHDGYKAPMTSLALRLEAKGELDRANFWFTKANKNKSRDREVNRELKKGGFTVLRLKSERLMGRDPEGYVSRSISMALAKGVRLAHCR